MRSTPTRVNTATFRGGLDRQSLVRAPAHARVLAFGVLADHDPVDVLRVRERALHAGQHARGPHVRVLVEALADRQAQAPERNVVGHLLAADRAEEDGVELLELLEAALGNVGAVLEIALRAPVELLDLETEAAVGSGDGLQHFESRVDDLGPDAIPADGGDLVRSHESSLDEE
jgi:hypothetical protein